ncbi:MAG: hypothetical protein GX080_02330 [Tissierellia bacterium]|nr:hypothetical protein [Tissierellia bacterium]
MKNKILALILVIGIIFFLTACKQDKNVLLPPEEDETLTFKFTNLIYQNDESTSYSIGGVGSQFTFSKDTLIVEDDGEVKTYEISYDEVPLTIEEFTKQFTKNNQIPDISSYDNTVQYNLCTSTNDSPGYRLYILDDQYWIGTLYKNYIWRIVSVDLVNEEL